MYDICIVGKWIVGNFLINRLNDYWLKICIISSDKNQYYNNNDFYNIYDYIDNLSIWNKKATWNITFPLTHEIKKLWFNVKDFNKFKNNIISELWWINFRNYNHNNISLLYSIFNDDLFPNKEYFITARNRIIEKEIFDRNEFDNYWQGNKTFLEEKEDNNEFIKWDVIKINEKVDFSEVFYKCKNELKVIKTKKIILACHTPSIINILLNSKDYIKDKIDFNLIGKWFMEHPQLSFWILIDDNKWSIKRNIPTTQIYNDIYIDWTDIKYRVEYHTAPPIKDKIYRYVKERDWIIYFQKQFLRLSILMEQKPSLKNSLNMTNWLLQTNSYFKEEVIKTTNIVKKDFLERIKKVNWIKLLYDDSWIWFSWHLMGWLQFLSNDKPYQIWELTNTYIASSSIFKVWWLFNPTFTILYIADLIVRDILLDFNI